MYLPSVLSKNCLLQVIQPLYSEGNDLIWNGQGFPPQIQRAAKDTKVVFAVQWIFGSLYILYILDVQFIFSIQDNWC